VVFLNNYSFEKFFRKKTSDGIVNYKNCILRLLNGIEVIAKILSITAMTTIPIIKVVELNLLLFFWPLSLLTISYAINDKISLTRGLNE